MYPLSSMRPNVTYTVPRLSPRRDAATNSSPYIWPCSTRSSRISDSLWDSVGTRALRGMRVTLIHVVRLVVKRPLRQSRIHEVARELRLFFGLRTLKRMNGPEHGRYHAGAFIQGTMTERSGSDTFLTKWRGSIDQDQLLVSQCCWLNQDSHEQRGPQCREAATRRSEPGDQSNRYESSEHQYQPHPQGERKDDRQVHNQVINGKRAQEETWRKALADRRRKPGSCCGAVRENRGYDQHRCSDGPSQNQRHAANDATVTWNRKPRATNRLQKVKQELRSSLHETRHSARPGHRQRGLVPDRLEEDAAW